MSYTRATDFLPPGGSYVGISGFATLAEVLGIDDQGGDDDDEDAEDVEPLPIFDRPSGWRSIGGTQDASDIQLR